MSRTVTEEEQQLLTQVTQWVNTHKDEFIDDLKTWVKVPSISRADQAKPGAPFGTECEKILNLVLDRAKTLGFKTENHEGYAGSILLGDYEKDIGLVSHLDVVPEGDSWIYPPFDAIQKGDFIVGRGSSDNKGPAVIDLYLLRLFRDLNIPLKHNIRVIYGLAEETNMADIAWYAQNGPVPEISIITDGKFPVNHAQKGHINLTLRVPVGERLVHFSSGIATNSVPERAKILLTDIDFDQVQSRIANLQGIAKDRISIDVGEQGIWLESKGIAGHAAFPEGTLSGARVLLSALLEAELLKGRDKSIAAYFEHALASPYGENIYIGFEDEISGKLTFNAGVWRALPDEKTLHISFDIRYPVAEKGEDIIQILKKELGQHDITIISERNASPFHFELTDPRVKTLQQTFHDITGSDAPPYSMGGGTHSKVLPRAITFGPGFPKTKDNTPDFLPKGHGFPHGADESVHIPTLLSVFPIYTLALIRLDRLLSQSALKNEE